MLNPITIKQLLSNAIDNVSTQYFKSIDPKSTCFSRKRKLPLNKLISFLITQGASSTRNELLDFYGLSPSDLPTNSALCQRRNQLPDSFLPLVFNAFNSSIEQNLHWNRYRFLAVDGSSFTFDSFDKFTSEEYYVSGGHSAKGFYSMHLNAFFDLELNVYTEALIQPVHKKDEFAAFCAMVDRHSTLDGIRNIYIGDRGYCSYNNMAHVIKSGQYFLFRAKDITSKGITKSFFGHLPIDASFDMDVSVSIVRSHSRKVKATFSKRFVDQNTTFEYIPYGSFDSYDISFRILRFPISESSYECILTNLPRCEFNSQKIKELYNQRWGIETSFRNLKYIIGLCNFHSYKPKYIKQEIWAKLLAYNATQLIIQSIDPDTNSKRKHQYKINFSTSAHISRVFLRLTTVKDSIDIVSLLTHELIPIRDGRKYKRLTTAHFRRPRHAVYRAA